MRAVLVNACCAVLVNAYCAVLVNACCVVLVIACYAVLVNMTKITTIFEVLVCNNTAYSAKSLAIRQGFQNPSSYYGYPTLSRVRPVLSIEQETSI